jgi:hypothetical protein
MIDQSTQTNISRREQRLLDVVSILNSQLDILDQDGWAIAAARLSTVVDTLNADLVSLNVAHADD